MPRWLPILAILISLPPAGLACDGNTPAGPDYDPDFDPADFVVGVDNPFLPLVPGTTWTYEGETEDGTETIVVEVLADTRTVAGIVAVVVRDRAFIDDELAEDTFDWFAQDRDGNVWYLGEDSKEIEDGEVVSTEGSWEAGVDGALPGIVMWADPAAHVGEEYRQEYYEGEAEDWGKVVALGQDVAVAFGAFAGCVRIEEWNDLEPGELENKFYCAGIGLVLETKEEERVELVEMTP